MLVSRSMLSRAWHVAALLWLVAAVSNSTAEEPPRASSRLPVGNGYRAPVVASADLDGDGRPDIVATFAWMGFTVWLVRGRGELVRAPWSSGIYPHGRPISVDLNGDAWPDLAVGTPVGVAVALGNGDGTFGPVQAYATGAWPTDVAAADLDADGALDLAAANEAAPVVTVLFGNGDGTFGQRLDLQAGAPQYAIDVGDLDGDGDLDLVTAYPRLSIFMGKGDGTFLPRHELGGVTQALDVAVADCDRDRRRDLAATDRQLAIFYGAGAGTFDPPRRFEAGGFPYSVAVADLDGDLRPDVAVGDLSASDVWLLFNPDLTTDALLPAPRPVALVAVFEPPDGGPVEILARFARPSPARVAILDVRGRPLWSWSGEVQAPGEHRWTWARRDRAGMGLARGVYFVQLRTPETTGTRRFALLHSASR